MGAYEREGDQLALLLSILEWVTPGRPTTPIYCAGCATVAYVAADGIDHVHGQMRLYRQGWRRVPGAALDYCPACPPG